MIDYGSACEGWLMNEIRPLPEKKHIYKSYALNGSFTFEAQCPYCDKTFLELRAQYCPYCGRLFSSED